MVTHPRVIAALLAVQVLFGTWPVVGKVVLRTVPGPALVGFRSVAAALVFFVLFKTVRPTRAQHAHLLLAATLGITINQLCFIAGLERTGAINATVLITTIPVFTLVAALLLRAEKWDARKGVGIILALAGAAWVVGPTRMRLDDAAAVGNGLLLVGAVAYGAYLVLVRRIAVELGALAMVPWIFLYGALTTLPFAVPSLVSAWPLRVDGTLVALLAYVVVGPTIGTYLLNAWALRQGAPPSLVAVFINLQPLIAAALAVPVLGEWPSADILAGAVLIFAGVTVSAWTRRA